MHTHFHTHKSQNNGGTIKRKLTSKTEFSAVLKQTTESARSLSGRPIRLRQASSIRQAG